MVIPSAWMFAFAPVSAMACKIVTYSATAGIGETDSSVDKDLCFDNAPGLFSYLFYSSKRKFSGEIDP